MMVTAACGWPRTGARERSRLATDTVPGAAAVAVAVAIKLGQWPRSVYWPIVGQRRDCPLMKNAGVEDMLSPRAMALSSSMT